jgi:hypothetical protein
MPGTQLAPKSVEVRELQICTQQQIAAIPSRQGEPLRATVTRMKSTGRVQSFLAILLAAFSMSPA